MAAGGKEYEALPDLEMPEGKKFYDEKPYDEKPSHLELVKYQTCTREQALAKYWFKFWPNQYFFSAQVVDKIVDYYPFFSGWGTIERHTRRWDESTNTEIVSYHLAYIQHYDLKCWMDDYIYPLVSAKLIELTDYDNIMMLLANNGHAAKLEEAQHIMSFIEDFLENIILEKINPRLEKGDMPCEAYWLSEFYLYLTNNLDITDCQEAYAPGYKEGSSV
jgi:hypothetical protein